MKKLELVTIHFEDFAGNFIFNLNCTMGKGGMPYRKPPYREISSNVFGKRSCEPIEHLQDASSSPSCWAALLSTTIV